jgi:HlyD family secretion protein
LDTAQAALDAAMATLKATEAQLNSVEARYKADEARLSQTRATLRLARVNLAHTIIASPISGTIISRNVDVGQTVAASFSAPTLFTIAADLTQMQVNTNIDEADVGKIKPGMDATFTVDAYPGESFAGTISQVRLATTTIQNVVTYNAIIDVPNPQLKLRPGMTANVKILIESAADVLRIPNSSLRFRPTLSDVEMEAAYKRAGEEKYYNYLKAMGMTGAASQALGTQAQAARPGGAAGMRSQGNGAPRRDASAMMARSRRGQRVPVWVLGGDKLLRPVIVKLGLTDGVNTQIEEAKLNEGDQIITGLEVEPTRMTTTTTAPPGFGGPPRGMPRGFR